MDNSSIMDPMRMHPQSNGRIRCATAFMREHVILIAAAAAALATIPFVPPDAAYLGYIDWKAICCLFSVLAVANAFRLIGAFDRIARMVLEHLSTMRCVVMALVATTAALSMVATNDMALIVMLPLSATTLVKAGWQRALPFTFAMQSIAANLCGMVVPFGNPQNLYLYSWYSLDLMSFLEAMLIPFLISLCLIAVTLTLLLRSRTEDPAQMAPASKLPLGRRRLAAYALLLTLTILAVFRIIPAPITVIAIICILGYADRRALKAVDYPLLLTFICFFIFAGNMARMPVLAEWLTSIMSGNELLASAGLSQVISNVPAAVLLSHFTDNWQGLLIGVNIGGAGTLVGSLASLITVQHFISAKRVFPSLRDDGTLSTGRFLVLFSALNLLFLFVLLGACLWIAS